jgi:CDP-4-dehydro-6-deoxyglucose reductase
MSYKITVTPSDHHFEVENNETILDAALEHGLAFPYGCRSGKCGSCASRLLTGEVTYLKGFTPKEEDIKNNKILLCQAIPKSPLKIEVAEVESTEGLEVRTLPARVEVLNKLNHDVMAMKLKLPDGERLQFLAGQYINILLKDGEKRAYSIANAPHDDQFIELHLREVPGGFFSNLVFHEMKEKAMLRLEGPLGSFFLREKSMRPIVLMAGGTGFAPVKAIVEHAIASKISRPIHIFWGVRSKQDLYHHNLASQWAENYKNIEYTPALSEPSPEDEWGGETGFVHDVVIKKFPDMSFYDVYLCGPPPMIDAGKKAFLARGLSEDRLFFDSFEFSHALSS